MTKDLNEYYGVTVHHAKKVGPKQWLANAEIFRRDTFLAVKEIIGHGGAQTRADSNAIEEAEREVIYLPHPPEDWNKPTQKGK